MGRCQWQWRGGLDWLELWTKWVVLKGPCWVGEMELASTQYAPRRAHHGCLQPSVAQGEGGGCNGGDRYGEVAALHRPRHQVSRRDCELGQNEVYEGLDIITNKITEEEQPGAPHHHLGIAHPNVDFTASDFRDMASLSIESILGGRRLPIIVGGSNSYIDARRAIGVPELDLYFQTGFLDEEARAKVLQEAVHEIKANTCKLACRQLEGIHRLKNLRKWKIHRLDATEVFLKRNREADEAWEKLVARPSTMMVAQFLYSVGATRVATEEMVRNAALLLLCDLVGDVV
ncbi:hypothetical protein AAG906_025829 [Vitis piasezkii]